MTYEELAREERKLAKSAHKLFLEGLLNQDWSDHHLKCAQYWDLKANASSNTPS